jgi:hypothetical protein
MWKGQKDIGAGIRLNFSALYTQQLDTHEFGVLLNPKALDAVFLKGRIG